MTEWNVYLYDDNEPVDTVEADTLNDALTAAGRKYGVPVQVKPAE